MVESQNFTSIFIQNTEISDFKPSTFIFFSKLYGGQKKISSPQFLSYDHQNFFGITSNDLEGRHVFIFSILYRKKLIFDFLVTLVRFFTHNSQISNKIFRKKRFKISTPHAPHIWQDTREEIINQ